MPGDADDRRRSSARRAGVLPVLALLALLFAVACAKARDDLPRISLLPASGPPATVAVEVVDTPAGRQLGLMYREALAPDSGMLFVFPESRPQAFWMRNTKIPLDICFIGDDGRIATIHRRTTPFSEASLPGGAPTRFVLEVAGGWMDAHGVREGDRVDLGELASRPGR